MSQKSDENGVQSNLDDSQYDGESMGIKSLAFSAKSKWN